MKLARPRLRQRAIELSQTARECETTSWLAVDDAACRLVRGSLLDPLRSTVHAYVARSLRPADSIGFLIKLCSSWPVRDSTSTMTSHVYFGICLIISPTRPTEQRIHQHKYARRRHRIGRARWRALVTPASEGQRVGTRWSVGSEPVSGSCSVQSRAASTAGRPNTGVHASMLGSP
jgi:hypothetical protein